LLAARFGLREAAWLPPRSHACPPPTAHLPKQMKINNTNRAHSLPGTTFPTTRGEPEPAPGESPGTEINIGPDHLSGNVERFRRRGATPLCRDSKRKSIPLEAVHHARERFEVAEVPLPRRVHHSGH